ncbi:uncharacterized protein FRV6_13070 [Fusarium oxysporum]|uniref:CPAF-like PDZ domain-containing protein n=1 Tax=Fusarium oxysporum TaxID=5507 RepID=A0A2H3TJU2_FUSOX|nr:uncharacterized protein FRV6_13070 [Fusarium oxysporum]
MPFYSELADPFLNELGKYVQWQYTLEVLKSPPDTYMYSPTDILGGLEIIRNTKYSSQWEFDQAIKSLINSANDGHFDVELCSFAPSLLCATRLWYAKLLNRAEAKISPVVSIDGRDASSYLKEIEDQALRQDPDARYNTLFFSFSGNPGGVLDGCNVYPGSNITTLEFRNGTTPEGKNMAELNDPGFEARNGKDVFDMYRRPTPPNSSDNSSTSEPVVKPPLKSSPIGYPEPLIRDPYNQMNGYYLDDDTVVMMIPSFDGDGLPSNQSLTLGHYTTEIVLKALADGRTKLIIDVSGNPGGDVDRAFNLFKLSLFASFNFTETSGNSDTPIRGYAGRPLNRTQPFNVENILIIGDGFCALTCSIFVNLMTNIGGVRALPFGGHPNGQPMQIMGGVQGSQTLTFDNTATVVSAVKAVYRETSEKLEFMTKEENERLMKVAPRPLDEFPIKLRSGQVNFLNAYQEGDHDLPLQFQYQAGDCRLYYTAENIYHPETIWKSAKEAIWGNGSCVKGSTGGTGSLEGRKNGKKNESEGG